MSNLEIIIRLMEANIRRDNFGSDPEALKNIVREQYLIARKLEKEMNLKDEETRTFYDPAATMSEFDDRNPKGYHAKEQFIINRFGRRKANKIFDEDRTEEILETLGFYNGKDS